MIRVATCCLLLITCVAGAAEGRRPSLGISVDLNPDPLSAAAGLAVTAVTEGSNGQRIGLRVGDRIVGAGERPVAAAADLQAALGEVAIGETLTLLVLRDEQQVELSGELKAETGVRDLAARARELNDQLAALQGGDPAAQPRYSLQELLVILRQIERDLPAAAAEFKRVYPDGRFRIGIHIDIDSHAPDGEPVDDPVAETPDPVVEPAADDQ